MADVNFTVGGRGYRLACRDGEEDALLNAARLLDEKVAPLTDSHGLISEARLLLMGALQLAGELQAARQQDAQPPADQPATSPDLLAQLSRLAEKAETLATSLEKSAANT